jgi:protein-S-isoprenylcysteine O-methyltransferase Ste14
MHQSIARFLAAIASYRRWESTFRIALPAAAITAMFFSGADLKRALPFEDVLESLSIGLTIIGLALRIAEYGFSDRTRTLQTCGAYSVLRHPILLSDALIGAGIVIGTQVLWFVLPGLTLLFALFWLAVWIRDEETARGFGAIIASWRTNTPALIPDLSHWNAGEVTFSAGTIERALPALFASVGLITALEIVHDVMADSADWNVWPADWSYYLAALAASLALVVADAGVRAVRRSNLSAG